MKRLLLPVGEGTILAQAQACEPQGGGRCRGLFICSPATHSRARQDCGNDRGAENPFRAFMHGEARDGAGDSFGSDLCVCTHLANASPGPPNWRMTMQEWRNAFWRQDISATGHQAELPFSVPELSGPSGIW
jgi:hypothetical protein